MSQDSELKLVLLGDDPRAMPLLRAWLDPQSRASKPDPARLVAAISSPDCLAQLRRDGLATDQLPTSLDSLLAGSLPDAVIVASDDASLLEMARELAVAGAAPLVLPLTGLTTAFAYELTLLQTDKPVVLYPLFLWRTHPLVQRVLGWLNRGALGAVQHVQLERRVRQASTTGGLRERNVTAAFLEDVDLLRLIVGEIANVTVVRSGTPDGEVLLQTVSLGSRVRQGEAAGPKATWSIATGPEEEMWRLTIAAEAGRAVLTGSAANYVLRLDVSGVPYENSPATMTGNPGSWWREQFDELRSKSAEKRAEAWTDFTRAFEITEGVERSIRRRRTIDLEFDVPSEQNQFKTHMTAAGCSLLLVTLFAVVVYLVVMQAFFPAPPSQRDRKETLSAAEQEVAAQAVQSRERFQRIALTVIFLPLGIFLGMQLLLLVARPAGRSKSGVPPDKKVAPDVKEKKRRP